MTGSGGSSGHSRRDPHTLVRIVKVFKILNENDLSQVGDKSESSDGQVAESQSPGHMF